MAFGSEKRAERRADEARRALIEEATAARALGLPLYFCSMPLGASEGGLVGGVGGGSTTTPNLAISEVLVAIEATGWRLDSAGYVFLEKGGFSASGIGGTGGSSVNGFVQGQFVFRPR